ncbi:MAG: Fe-S cluster assembly protein SufD [Pseudomonadota bacterium]|nr:Fe-S cluster assembly protein SufD [Pseudomonadota bacterium]
MTRSHTETAQAWLSGFQAEFTRKETDLAWLGALRNQARATFQKQGLPTTRTESWKYTSLAPLLDTEYHLAQTEEEAAAQPYVPSTEGFRIVLVNGHFAPGLSRLPQTEEWSLMSLYEASRLTPGRLEDHLLHPNLESGFSSLNEAFWEDGVFLYLNPAAQVKEPVWIICVNVAHQASISHPRLAISLGRHSRLALIEYHVGQGPYLSNIRSTIHLDENAHLDYLRLQCEHPLAHHIADIEFTQRAGATLQSHSFTLGGALSRISLSTCLSDAKASCRLFGLMLGQNHQHQDEHTHIRHAAAHTHSEEHYRSIQDDASHGIFCGRIKVEAGALQCTAKQTSHNLLLSPSAEATTLPQLEILNDDITCSHGATVGQLDETALFYLISRGLDPDEARALLKQAFAKTILDSIPNPALKDKISRLIQEKLGQPLRQGGAHVFFHD